MKTAKIIATVLLFACLIVAGIFLTLRSRDEAPPASATENKIRSDNIPRAEVMPSGVSSTQSHGNLQVKEYPSLAPFLGKELTPEVVRTMPYRDCSTLDQAFLGFLKSVFEGSLRDHIFYLTPEARKATTGVIDEGSISDEKARRIAESINQDNRRCRDLTLESFHIVSDTSSPQIEAILSSVCGKMFAREMYEIAAVQTNEGWRFSSVNVSTIERRRLDQ